MTRKPSHLIALVALTLSVGAGPAAAWGDRPSASSRGGSTLDQKSTIVGRNGQRTGTVTQNGLDGDLTFRDRRGQVTQKHQRTSDGYIIRNEDGQRTGFVRDPR